MSFKSDTSSSWGDQSTNKSTILSDPDERFQKRNTEWFPSGTGLEDFSRKSKYSTIGRRLKPMGGRKRTKGIRKSRMRAKKGTRKYKNRKTNKNKK